MKEILLLGNGKLAAPFVDLIRKSPKFKLKTTYDPGRAEKELAKHAPDFFLCAGTFRVNEDGEYFIEL